MSVYSEPKWGIVIRTSSQKNIDFLDKPKKIQEKLLETDLYEEGVTGPMVIKMRDYT